MLSLAGYIGLANCRLRCLGSLSPLIVITSITDILYVGGLLSFLQPLAWILIIGGWVALGYNVVYRYLLPIKPFNFHGIWTGLKTQSAQYVRLSLVFFFIFATLLYLFSFNQQIHHVDEFRYWALMARYLCDFNQLPSINSPITLLDYVPGMALFQYWCMQLLHYTVPNMYFSQTLIVAAGITVLFGNLSWKDNKKSIIFLIFSLAIGLTTFTNALITLTADPLIGIIWAALLVGYILHREQKRIIWQLLPIMLFLSLIKSSTLVFAAMTWIFFALDQAILHQSIDKRLRHKGLLGWLLGLFLLVLVIVAWKIHIADLKATASFNSSFSWSNLQQQLQNKEFITDAKLFLKRFVLFDSVSGMSGIFVIVSYKHFYSIFNILSIFIILLWLFILQVGLYFTYKTPSERKQFRLTLYWMWATVGLFVIGLFYAYEFLLEPQAKLMNTSLSRYIVAPSLGLFLFTFTLIAHYLGTIQNTKKQISLLLGGSFLLVGITTQLQYTFFDILLQKKLYITSALQDYQPLAQQVLKDIPAKSRLYIIDQDNLYLGQQLGYNFYPIRITYNYYIASTSDTDINVFLDKVTVPINLMSEKKFAELLQQQDYVLLISSDAAFWLHYKRFFDVKNLAQQIYLFKVEHQPAPQLILIKTYPAVKITAQPDAATIFRDMSNTISIN